MSLAWHNKQQFNSTISADLLCISLLHPSFPDCEFVGYQDYIISERYHIPLIYDCMLHIHH